MKKQFVYYHCDNTQLDFYATLHESPTPQKKGLILYLHGGGLIYGHRDDLPEIYIKMLNDAGYSLLSLDYPFIPEVKIDYILKSLSNGIKNLQDSPYLQQERINHLIYFGRSAGAYLALQLAKMAKTNTVKKIISFYGYYSLEDALLTTSSPYYSNYPVVPFMTVQSLIQNRPLLRATIEERFPIYLSFRQTGRWIQEILGQRNNASDYSLTKEDLNDFPPTFITASHDDQDVPFVINEQMNALIPKTKNYFIHDLKHDFDSDDHLETSISCYKALINWLDT